jgi:predicted metalloenzyme YecM
MKYETKEEAMKHISTTNTKVAAKQTEMINLMYDFGMTVTQNDMDNIALDCHKDAMKKAMSY